MRGDSSGREQRRSTCACVRLPGRSCPCTGWQRPPCRARSKRWHDAGRPSTSTTASVQSPVRPGSKQAPPRSSLAPATMVRSSSAWERNCWCLSRLEILSSPGVERGVLFFPQCHALCWLSRQRHQDIYMLRSLAEGPSPPLLSREESTLCGLILHQLLPMFLLLSSLAAALQQSV